MISVTKTIKKGTKYKACEIYEVQLVYNRKLYMKHKIEKSFNSTTKGWIFAKGWFALY